MGLFRRGSKISALSFRIAKSLGIPEEVLSLFLGLRSYLWGLT